MATFQTIAGGMPVLSLKEGTKENKGREAQKSNIAAGIGTRSQQQYARN